MRATVHIRDGFDNHFTVLRIVMALLVLVGHGMIIGERSLTAEPMVLGRYSLSYMAVNAFFIASGFLVTASMMHRRRVLDFAVARGLRIYPALIVHVLFLILLVGAANTTLPLSAYLTHPDTWLQLPKVLTFTDLDVFLPGTFESNHERYASAPLWTLRFELMAYIGTAVVFALGLMRHRWMVACQFVGFALAWPALHVLGLWDGLPPTLQNIFRFGLAYGLGAAIWACREQMPFRWAVLPLLIAATWIGADWAVGEVAFNMMVGYGLFLLAYCDLPRVELPDISYGVYIYHWPVLQWLAAKNPDMGTPTLLMASVPIVVGISWLSWQLVEKPMLARKGPLADALRRRSKPVTA